LWTKPRSDLTLVQGAVVGRTIQVHYIARILRHEERCAELPCKVVEFEPLLGHSVTLFVRDPPAVVWNADQER
jgi:hypothetical protein